MLGRRAREIASIVVLAAFSAGPALAGPGEHIHAGDATITPSISTGLEYHTNAYLADGGQGQPEIPAMAWTLKPRVAMNYKGRQILWDLGVGYQLKKFIDLDPNDVAQTDNLDQFNAVDANTSLTLFPTGIAGFKLEDNFLVVPTATELEPIGGNGTANITHTSNDLRGGLQVRPGTAIDINLFGNLGVDTYDVPLILQVDSATSTSYNDRLAYGPQVAAAWRFLPKTSLNGMFSYNWVNWRLPIINAIGAEIEGSNVGNFLGKPDSTVWRTQWGLRGQFTEKLAAEVLLGYGQMNYDETSVPANADPQGEEGYDQDLTDFSQGFLVNAQVGYSPIKGQSLTAGYRKDFQDAVFTNYVLYNYLYLRYEGLYFSRLGLGAEAGYRIDAYHGEIVRDDQNLILKGNAAYRITDFFSTNLSVTWNRRACLEADCHNNEYYSTQFDDVVLYGGATFTY